MKQVQTTIILASFALVSLAVAVTVYYRTLPGKGELSELIGEPFYPEFTEPEQAISLELIVWDSEEKKPKSFSIKKVDDLWTIPSHGDYPVESAELLRETAGSVMDIKRLSLAGRTTEEHGRLGVIDPEDKDAKKREPGEIGDRIRLLDASGNTVCDFVIGNAVESEAEVQVQQDRELVKGERYYVRQPDQNEVFVAELDLQISTEFSDWIDSDLLKMGTASVQKINFQNYDVKDEFVSKFGGEVPVRDKYEQLIVEKENGSWKLDDLKEDTEELDASLLTSFTQEFKNLKILEVEEKPVFPQTDIRILNADLTVNGPPGMSQNQQLGIQQQFLGPMGFRVGLKKPTSSKFSLLSQNGELSFATDDGLIYNVFFGYDVTLTGSEFKFSPGEKGDSEKDGKQDQEKGDEDDQKTPDDPPKSDANKEDKNKKKGKIMSVFVTFDEALIEKPVKPFPPIEPVKPVREAPGKAPEKSSEPKKSDSPAPQSKSAEDLKQNPAKSDQGSKPSPKKNTESSPEKKPQSKKAQSASDPEKKEESDCGVWLIQDDGKQDPKQEDPKQDPAKKQEKAKQDQKDAPKKTDSKRESPKKESSKQESPKEETKSQSDPAKKLETPAEGDAGQATDAKKNEPAKSTQEDNKANKDSTDPNQPLSNQEPAKTADQIFNEKMLAYQQAMIQYRQAKARYETELKNYDKQMEDYKKKVEENRKKAEDLNARFGDWFYIVDSENLEKIKISRADLVKPKTKTETENKSPLNLPNLNNLPPNLRIPKVDPADPAKGAPKKDDSGEKSTKQETPQKGAPAEPNSSAKKSKDKSENPKTDVKLDPARPGENKAPKSKDAEPKNAKSSDKSDPKSEPGTAAKLDAPAKKSDKSGEPKK